MPTFILDPSYTIRDSCQARIILHYIHVSHHTIHTQTNINHLRLNEHPNSALPRPIPRSGWRRGLKRGNREQCGISLRQDPSRLGEMLARSKRRAGRLGDLSRRSLRRAPCFILPRRDWLAWARFTGLVTGSSGTAMFSNQPNIQNVLTHQIERLNHTSSNQRKHWPKRLETKDSNFPYLE